MDPTGSPLRIDKSPIGPSEVRVYGKKITNYFDFHTKDRTLRTSTGKIITGLIGAVLDGSEDIQTIPESWGCGVLGGRFVDPRIIYLMAS